MRQVFVLSATLFIALAIWFALTGGDGGRPAEGGRSRIGPASVPEAEPAPAPVAAATSREALPPPPDSLGPVSIPLATALAGVPIEAHPVASMVWAIATRSLDDLPPLYTPRIRATLAARGFARYANKLDATMAAQIGRYDPAALHFVFVDTAENDVRDRDGVRRGSVRVEHGGKRLGTMRVAFVDGRWLIDET